MTSAGAAAGLEAAGVCEVPAGRWWMLASEFHLRRLYLSRPQAQIPWAVAIEAYRPHPHH